MGATRWYCYPLTVTDHVSRNAIQRGGGEAGRGYTANAYDSLGEAYLKAQDKQRALDAYRKSVELDAKNTNAKQIIDRIERAP
jgi:predicted negative regulator of RcsB-dependent stress response